MLEPVVTWLAVRGLNRGLAAVLAIVALGTGAFLFPAVVVGAGRWDSVTARGSAASAAPTPHP